MYVCMYVHIYIYIYIYICLITLGEIVVKPPYGIPTGGHLRGHQERQRADVGVRGAIYIYIYIYMYRLHIIY